MIFDIDCLPKKCIIADKLPTLDSLVLHLRRANYQSFIWKSACSPVLQLPSPVEHGWCLVDGELSQEKMLNAPVPDSIIELTRCNCRRGCKSNACSCRREALLCTDSCS